jgi:hypothetical protein
MAPSSITALVAGGELLTASVAKHAFGPSISSALL